MDPTTSMVAEAALGALFQHLLDTLAPPFLNSLGLPFGVEKKVEKLKSTLARIEELVTKAEEGQLSEESAPLWLSDLKHVAYDAQDILDEQACIAPMQLQTRKRKLTDMVPHFFSRFSSNFKLGSRIMKITERLDEILRERNQFHLEGSKIKRPRMRDPSSSIVNESIVFRREADKAKVVRLLTLDYFSASGSGIQVDLICGMPRVGKMTLAQLIYNDERVKKHFYVNAWVLGIQVIKNSLKGKKLLLVLDDVWNENYNLRDVMLALLMVAGRGSRIVVSTRSQRVSSIMGTERLD